ncbi:MAG TPA: DUF5361 domain-containing protein [Candidatus Jeotgalibaca pullicola]|nr:DUF5361 domain-containing protein [Candidatus Jeotgalibaca pullicola]
MIKADEDALICDLAETYHIYDYRRLSPFKIAVFSFGLKDDSRIKMKLSGQKIPLNILLLAGVNDRLSTLVWAKTKDGQKGKNPPESIVDLLTKEKQEKNNIAFINGEDFETKRKEILLSMEVK